ncbi:hypothetical protein [Nocardia suismassiliense]|uniref:hypothetical protein n=1 Tax=Nocardia suismassiliense TaxID=2077092 RepID=UPI001F1FAF6E|nr:hypothetical protein [Nocardia suismassiliense]
MLGALVCVEPVQAARTPLVDTAVLGRRFAATVAVLIGSRRLLLPELRTQRQIVDSGLRLAEDLPTLVRRLVALEHLDRLLEPENLSQERLAARPHRPEQTGIDQAPPRFEHSGLQVREQTARLLRLRRAGGRPVGAVTGLSRRGGRTVTIATSLARSGGRTIAVATSLTCGAG